MNSVSAMALTVLTSVCLAAQADADDEVVTALACREAKVLERFHGDIDRNTQSILSGKALTLLADALRGQPIAGAHKLSARELSLVRLEISGFAATDPCKGGAVPIEWAGLLARPEAAAIKEQLESSIRDALSDRENGESQMREAMLRARRWLADMCPSGTTDTLIFLDMLESKRQLDRLEKTRTVAAAPIIDCNEEWTIESFVTFVIENNWSFGSCPRGGEVVYRRIFIVLRNLDSRFSEKRQRLIKTFETKQKETAQLRLKERQEAGRKRSQARLVATARLRAYAAFRQAQQQQSAAQIRARVAGSSFGSRYTVSRWHYTVPTTRTWHYSVPTVRTYTRTITVPR